MVEEDLMVEEGQNNLQLSSPTQSHQTWSLQLSWSHSLPNVAVQRRAAFGASVATACWATCEDQGRIFTNFGPITRSATSVSYAA